MVGYKLTIEQKNAIQGVFYNENTFFNCVQDINNDWFVFLSESDKMELVNTEFDYLLNIQETTFKKILIEEIEANYINNTSNATYNSTNNSIFFNQNFNTIKDVFESGEGITITNIKAKLNVFMEYQTITLNNSIVINCVDIQNSNPSLFTLLQTCFNEVKQQILSTL
jgi:hypothetical protein